MTVPAHAQETVYSFDIPAQDLGGALRAFGQATNQQIIFADDVVHGKRSGARSEEHTSELQSLMRISYAVFCLKKKKNYWRHHMENHRTDAIVTAENSIENTTHI